MRSLRTCALALAMWICAQQALAQAVPVGVRGSIPVCTYAALQAGTCQKAIAGYLATITDGNPADADKCATAGTGGVPGNQFTCRFNGDTSAWEEFSGTGGSGTNLGSNVTPSDVTITSNTGSPALIPAATPTTAGVMASTDKTNLDLLFAADVFATVVNDWAELEAAMRAADQPDLGPYQPNDLVQVSVKFSDTFVGDWDSATPHRINLPTGGGQNGFVRIDFGPTTISAANLVTVELNYGRTDGSGTLTPCDTGGGVMGYLRATAGCMGAAHDLRVIIDGGIWPSRYSGCDVAPTAQCGRVALKTLNSDLLFFGSGTTYGTHLVIGPNFKCGATTGATGESIFPIFNLPGDSCLELTPGHPSITISGTQHWESLWGLRVLPPQANGNASNSTRYHIGEGMFFQQSGSLTAGSCSRCAAGFFDLQNDNQQATITLDSPIFNSRFGNLRGAKLLGSVITNFPGATGVQCFDPQNGGSTFISNGTDEFERLSGHLTVTGIQCVENWVSSGGIGALKIDAVLNAPLPGFLASDTALGATPRPKVLDSVNTGIIHAAEFSFTSENRIPTGDIVLDDLFGTAVKTGGALSNQAGDYALVTIGPDAFVYTENGAATLRKSTRNQWDRASREIVSVMTRGGTALAGSWPTNIQCLVQSGNDAPTGCGANQSSGLMIDNTAGDHYIESLVCDLMSVTHPDSGSITSIKANWSAGATAGSNLGVGVTFSGSDAYLSTKADSVPVAIPSGIGRVRIKIDSVTELGGADFGVSCSATISRRPT